MARHQICQKDCEVKSDGGHCFKYYYGNTNCECVGNHLLHSAICCYCRGCSSVYALCELCGHPFSPEHPAARASHLNHVVVKWAPERGLYVHAVKFDPSRVDLVELSGQTSTNSATGIKLQVQDSLRAILLALAAADGDFTNLVKVRLLLVDSGIGSPVCGRKTLQWKEVNEAYREFFVEQRGVLTEHLPTRVCCWVAAVPYPDQNYLVEIEATAAIPKR